MGCDEDPIPLAGDGQGEIGSELILADEAFVDGRVHLHGLALPGERLGHPFAEFLHAAAGDVIHAGDLPLGVAPEAEMVVALHEIKVILFERQDLRLVAAGPLGVELVAVAQDRPRRLLVEAVGAHVLVHLLGCKLQGLPVFEGAAEDLSLDTDDDRVRPRVRRLVVRKDGDEQPLLGHAAQVRGESVDVPAVLDDPPPLPVEHGPAVTVPGALARAQLHRREHPVE